LTFVPIIRAASYKKGFFFSEEKKQKTFMSPHLPRWKAKAAIYPRAPELKVFWFFSSEKNIVLKPSPTPPRSPQ
jgi:hypothetical protein